MEHAFATLLGLGVPQLLDAEDTIKVQDTKSIQTYLFTYAAIARCVCFM
jgi:hypothetical protein